MHIIRMLVLGGSTQCITIYLEAALTLGWLGSDHRYGLSSVGCPEAKEGLAGWRSVARKYYNSNLQDLPGIYLNTVVMRKLERILEYEQ
ncbi:hypothetical protein AFLA_007895 [Aspergillus flavus NRRL3357]|nr:hypothetical protein AFLA_007895 [Aspergillus flavus NRRL3357]